MVFQHLKGVARQGLCTCMIAGPIEHENGAGNNGALPHFRRSEGEPMGRVHLSDRAVRQPGTRRIVLLKEIDKDRLKIPNHHIAIFKRRQVPKWMAG